MNPRRRVEQLLDLFRRTRAKVAWAPFLVSRRLNSGELGIVAQHGIGDHFLVCAFATSLKQQFGKEIVVSGRQQLAFTGDLFEGVARYEALPPWCWGHQVGRRQVASGRWAYGHFWDMELARAIGYKRFSLLDAYRCRFGLPPDAKLEKPAPASNPDCNEAERLMRHYGVRMGRTVILCPQARSTPHPSVTADRLREAIAVLRNLNWDVLVSAEITNLGAPRATIPLRLFRAFVQLAGGFMSVRSGLCDLVCGIPVRSLVLYSEVKYLGGSLFTGTNLAGYGYSHLPQEYIVEEGDTQRFNAKLRETFES